MHKRSESESSSGPDHRRTHISGWQQVSLAQGRTWQASLEPFFPTEWAPGSPGAWHQFLFLLNTILCFLKKRKSCNRLFCSDALAAKRGVPNTERVIVPVIESSTSDREHPCQLISWAIAAVLLSLVTNSQFIILLCASHCDLQDEAVVLLVSFIVLPPATSSKS